MAKAIGVPRQSIGHYLKSGGAKGAQAAAIIGLVARTALREQRLADDARLASEARQSVLMDILSRFDPR